MFLLSIYMEEIDWSSVMSLVQRRKTILYTLMAYYGYSAINTNSITTTELSLVLIALLILFFFFFFFFRADGVMINLI